MNKQQYSLDIELNNGYVTVIFNIEVLTYYDKPAYLFGLPEDCTPAESAFEFDVLDMEISRYGDHYISIESGKLIELIVLDYSEEVLKQYLNNIE